MYFYTTSFAAFRSTYFGLTSSLRLFAVISCAAQHMLRYQTNLTNFTLAQRWPMRCQLGMACFTLMFYSSQWQMWNGAPVRTFSPNRFVRVYVLLLEPVCYFSYSLFLFDQLVKSNAQYDSILRENSNTLVVIKFFAPWCRSCKALDVKYRRMAVKYENVTFVEVREKNRLTAVRSNTRCARVTTTTAVRCSLLSPAAHIYTSRKVRYGAGTSAWYQNVKMNVER